MPMPRFVLLEHDHPFPHWDFMLEEDDGLRTWRLATLPLPGQIVPAEPLGTHRKLYLDYEGPVSGGRGSVRRWDHGSYEADPSAPAGEMRVLLCGEKLRGVVVLRQGPDDAWSLELESPDAAAE
jgi:hypothetical protein